MRLIAVMFRWLIMSFSFEFEIHVATLFAPPGASSALVGPSHHGVKGIALYKRDTPSNKGTFIGLPATSRMRHISESRLDGSWVISEAPRPRCSKKLGFGHSRRLRQVTEGRTIPQQVTPIAALSQGSDSCLRGADPQNHIRRRKCITDKSGFEWHAVSYCEPPKMRLL
jgi:hypothetical protein